MRCGIDISKALPPRDGLGRYSAELVRALPAALDERDELFVYDLERPLDPRVFDEHFPRMSQYVRPRSTDPGDDGLDVFHATAWSVPPRFTGPLVFTCYDLTFLTHPECHTVDNRIRCLTGLLEARLADAAFVAISRATAAELERQLGLPSSEIRVIYPAAAPTFRPRPEGETRRRLHERFRLTTGSFVLAVGTLEPRKNLARLAEAHAGLPRPLRDAHPLVIAGAAGWKLDEAELGPDVRRLGFVDRDDLVALYNGATLFAYPSLTEGFGLPVVEAMACGTPVMTSNGSSLAEVAGDAARLVDPLDVGKMCQALTLLIKSPAERRRLGERGLERASAFSWESAARRTLVLYRELAEKR